MKRLVCVLAALCLLLTACGAPAEVAPTPTPTSAATPALTPAPTPMPTPSPTSAPTPAPVAQELEISLSGIDRAGALLDDKFLPACRLEADAAITVEADEEIGALYLVWYDRPQPCAVETPGGSVSAGEKGFMHEYIPLDAPAPRVTLRLHAEKNVRLSEIRAYSPGVPDDAVQVWREPCEQADLLVVPTHADDEFVFFGGVLPLYAAERGYTVQVVYLIDHYGSLRERCDELLNALWYAGVRHYPVIHDAPDRILDSVGEAEAFYGASDFLDFEVEMLRRFKPLVVLTHDENGEYRQSNHMLTARSMELAVSLAADESYLPETAARYGVWDTPKLYLHLYGPAGERTVLDFETPLSAFDGLTAFEAAERAFALHRSQQEWHFRVYEAGHPYDCHSYGLFRSLVGPDEARDDLMEHIDPAAWREQPSTTPDP